MDNHSHKFKKKKAGVFFFKSSSPFEFHHILNGIDIEPKEESITDPKIKLITK